MDPGVPSVQPARTPKKAQLSAQPELSPLDFAAVKNLCGLSDAHHRLEMRGEVVLGIVDGDGDGSNPDKYHKSIKVIRVMSVWLANQVGDREEEG